LGLLGSDLLFTVMPANLLSPIKVVEFQKDRGTTDKGYGNFNTYRWIAHILVSGINFYTVHFPLSGDSKTRTLCAKHYVNYVKQFKNNVLTGDFNNFTVPGESEFTDKSVLQQLSVFKNVLPECTGTFIGYDYDHFKNKVENGIIIADSCLDYVLTDMEFTDAKLELNECASDHAQITVQIYHH
jgi:endonuclease/exonuclease/phosphatase family metal-dependent hydrolase